MKGHRHRFQGTLRTIGNKQFISGVVNAKERQTDSIIAGLWREEIGAPVAEAGYGGGFTAGLQPGSLVPRQEVRRKVQDHQHPL